MRKKFRVVLSFFFYKIFLRAMEISGKIIGEESGFDPSFDLRSLFFKLFA
jgi:hypothetical protein